MAVDKRQASNVEGKARCHSDDLVAIRNLSWAEAYLDLVAPSSNSRALRRCLFATYTELIGKKHQTIPAAPVR